MKKFLKWFRGCCIESDCDDVDQICQDHVNVIRPHQQPSQQSVSGGVPLPSPSPRAPKLVSQVFPKEPNSPKSQPHVCERPEPEVQQGLSGEPSPPKSSSPAAHDRQCKPAPSLPGQAIEDGIRSPEEEIPSAEYQSPEGGFLSDDVLNRRRGLLAVPQSTSSQPSSFLKEKLPPLKLTKGRPAQVSSGGLNALQPLALNPTARGAFPQQSQHNSEPTTLIQNPDEESSTSGIAPQTPERSHRQSQQDSPMAPEVPQSLQADAVGELASQLQHKLELEPRLAVHTPEKGPSTLEGQPQTPASVDHHIQVPKALQRVDSFPRAKAKEIVLRSVGSFCVEKGITLPGALVGVDIGHEVFFIDLGGSDGLAKEICQLMETKKFEGKTGKDGGWSRTHIIDAANSWFANKHRAKEIVEMHQSAFVKTWVCPVGRMLELVGVRWRVQTKHVKPNAHQDGEGKQDKAVYDVRVCFRFPRDGISVSYIDITDGPQTLPGDLSLVKHSVRGVRLPMHPGQGYVMTSKIGNQGNFGNPWFHAVPGTNKKMYSNDHEAKEVDFEGLSLILDFKYR